MESYRIQALSFAYPLQQARALQEITLAIPGGQFVCICGRSGSGKSTLLRQLKPVLAPHGERTGTIHFRGQLLEEVSEREQAAGIGFVQQQPDNQIVTDKVWHELAFGLESLGERQEAIRLRVAEMASFFGIQAWFHRPVSELSGGQKQLLSLASIMAMQPSVLLLDEPASQLDPIAAADFMATLAKINRELGVTVIMTEHRLEEVLPLADRLIVMDQGRIIADDTPARAGAELFRLGHPMRLAMPAPMQIAAAVQAAVDSAGAWEADEASEAGGVGDAGGTHTGHGEASRGMAQGSDNGLPVTVKAGRDWLDAAIAPVGAEQAPAGLTQPPADSTRQAAAPGCSASKGDPVIRFKDVWFRYSRDEDDVIKDLSVDIYPGQFYCIVGGNGTGKTSTLSLISGINVPYRGKVLVQGSNPARIKPQQRFTNFLGVLPQNPQTLFVKKTVQQDLQEMLSGFKLSDGERQAKLERAIAIAELEPLLDMHPYDLSGGEQQRAALAKVLLLEPSILLLDEPTKGLDAFYKEKLALLLRELKKAGKTIVMVSHDIEFCARHADLCALFFDGSIITAAQPQPFFAGNSFYTTAANRMSRHLWQDAITTEDVVDRCLASR